MPEPQTRATLSSTHCAAQSGVDGRRLRASVLLPSSRSSKLPAGNRSGSLDVSRLQPEDRCGVPTRFHGRSDHSCQCPHSSVSVHSLASTQFFRHLRYFFHRFGIDVDIERVLETGLVAKPRVKIAVPVFFLFHQDGRPVLGVFHEHFERHPGLDEPVSHGVFFLFRKSIAVGVGVVTHGDLEKFSLDVLVQRLLRYLQYLEWILSLIGSAGFSRVEDEPPNPQFLAGRGNHSRCKGRASSW
mmetsp:Transcript_26155/g.71727  ORF Transcript_26155/g.71727 Transcript_26155/m.71727 type:complete len:242 (-) Transcript_26155:477-1202(-)